MVVFGQKWLYSGKKYWGLYLGKVVVFGQKWLYSGKVVVFGKKWFYSGKSCFRVVFGQSGCIYLGFYSCKIWVKVVVFGQNVAKYSGKVVLGQKVVFGQKWLYSGKVVVFGQKWLYSGKSGCN